MASLRFHFFKLLLRRLKTKRFREEKAAPDSYRKRDKPEPPSSLFQKFSVNKFVFSKRNVFRIAPKNPGASKEIIYFHGGGYVANFDRYHWDFIGELARQSGSAV